MQARTPAISTGDVLEGLSAEMSHGTLSNFKLLSREEQTQRFEEALSHVAKGCAEVKGGSGGGK